MMHRRRSSSCILTRYPIINNKHLPCSETMTGRWQSVGLRCSTRGEDVRGSFYKRQIEMIDRHDRRCHSQMVPWSKSPPRASYCTSTQICKSPACDEGKSASVSEQKSKSRVGYEKEVSLKPWGSDFHFHMQQVGAGWAQHGSLGRGWCDKQSWISRRGFHWALTPTSMGLFIVWCDIIQQFWSKVAPSDIKKTHSAAFIPSVCRLVTRHRCPSDQFVNSRFIGTKHDKKSILSTAYLNT